MKVHELLEKKFDSMSERDYIDFACAIGSQFGLVLKTALKLKSLDGIEDRLVPVLLEQDVVEVQKGVFAFVYDTSPAGIEKLRAQLYGAAL